MKSALAAFERNIRELRWFIQSLHLERSVLSTLNACDAIDGDPTNTLREWSSHLTSAITKRRFDYNSIVITLYGLLEQYVENLILGYTHHLNSVTPSFSGIPEPVKNSHLDLSIALISILKQNRYKGTLTEESVVSNLHSCIQGHTLYQLNHDAFIQHSANFRVAYINDIFNRIGIAGVSQRVSSYSPLLEHLEAIYPGRDILSIPIPEIFFLLDDLVERRNEVAHGSVSQLLSFDMLLDHVNFIELFGQALFNVVFSSGIQISAKYHGIELGSPIQVINHSIVCMEMKNVAIQVGDILVAKTEQSIHPILHGEIITLQIDKQPFSAVPPQSSVNVGIQIPFRTKASHQFTLIPQGTI